MRASCMLWLFLTLAFGRVLAAEKTDVIPTQSSHHISKRFISDIVSQLPPLFQPEETRSLGVCVECTKTKKQCDVVSLKNRLIRFPVAVVHVATG